MKTAMATTSLDAYRSHSVAALTAGQSSDCERLRKRRERAAIQRSKRKPVTQEVLIKYVHYEPATGQFIRKLDSGTAKAGSIATFSDGQGYVSLSIDGQQIRAHRAAFLYMTGAWPSMYVDHINRVRSDNRWENLRDVRSAVNMQNAYAPRSRSKSGMRGVSYCKREKKWRASIQIQRPGQEKGKGQYRSLGYFSTPEAAQQAYLAAKASHHEGAQQQAISGNGANPVRLPSKQLEMFA